MVELNKTNSVTNNPVSVVRTNSSQATPADSSRQKLAFNYQEWKKTNIFYYRYDSATNTYTLVKPESVAGFRDEELFVVINNQGPVQKNLDIKNIKQALEIVERFGDVRTEKLLLKTITYKTYENWKKNYLKFFRYDPRARTVTLLTSETEINNCPKDLLCAFIFDPFNGYHSEGQAWGLLTAVHFKDAALFKSLFNGLKKMERYGLPSWRISLNNSSGENVGATLQVVKENDSFTIWKNGEKLKENIRGGSEGNFKEQIKALSLGSDELNLVSKLFDDLQKRSGNLVSGTFRPTIKPQDRSSASDADQDIVAALIRAWQLVTAEKYSLSKKWDIPGDVLKNKIVFYLRRMREAEIEFNGLSYLWRPSEDWGASGIGVGTTLNLSYLQASFFELFGDFDPAGDFIWKELARSTLSYRQRLVTGKEKGISLEYSEAQAQGSTRQLVPFVPPDWVAVGRSGKTELFYRIPHRSSNMGVSGLRTFLRIAFDAFYGPTTEIKNESIALAKKIIKYYVEDDPHKYNSLKIEGKTEAASGLYKITVFAALAKAAYHASPDDIDIKQFYLARLKELGQNLDKYGQPDYVGDYFLNSLNLLAQMILSNSFAGIPDKKMWTGRTAKPIRDAEVISQKYPWYTWLLDLVWVDKESGEKSVSDNILKLASPKNSSPDSLPKYDFELHRDLALAQNLLTLKYFRGPIQKFCAIIRCGDYTDRKHQRYMDAAYEGLEGAYLESGMAAQEFCAFVNDILADNAPHVNPYFHLVHANALFLTYDPDRYDDFLRECRQILKEEVKKFEAEKSGRKIKIEANPIIVARALLLLVNSYLTIKRDFLTPAEKNLVVYLAKLAGGEVLTADEEKSIKDSGLLRFKKDNGADIDITNSLVAIQENFKGYLRKLFPAKLFRNPGPNQLDNFPYQTQDNFSYLLSFTRARCLVVQASGIGQASETSQNLLKGALDLLFVSLNLLPRGEGDLEKPSLHRMIIDISKELDSVCQELYRLSNKQEYLELAHLIPAYLLKEGYSQRLETVSVRGAFPEMSRVSLDAIQKTLGAIEEKAPAIELKIAALERSSKTLATGSIEKDWANVTYSVGKIAAMPYKITPPAKPLVPGEMNCLLEMSRAGLVTATDGPQTNQTVLNNNLTTIINLLPTNRVRQCFDRIEHYLALGERQLAGDYIDEIEQIIKYASGTQINSVDTAQSEITAFHLTNLTRGIREGLLAYQDYEKASKINRQHLKLLKEALEYFYDASKKQLKNSSLIFLSPTEEQEKFKKLLERLEGLPFKRFENGQMGNQTVSEVLTGFDRMEDLEALARLAEVLSERLRFLCYLKKLKASDKNRYEKETKVLGGIADFKPLVEGPEDEQKLARLYRDKLDECSKELQQVGYSPDNYEALIKFAQDLVWNYARRYLVPLRMEQNDKLARLRNSFGSDPTPFINSGLLMSEILNLPVSYTNFQSSYPEVRELVTFMRDPESFGMKSKIFTSKPYLEKDCYLLLAALKALEGADSDVAGYFSKAFYRNPNDRWIYELARRLIPSYLDKDLLGFGINDGKNLGEKLNTGRIISQERSGY